MPPLVILAGPAIVAILVVTCDRCKLVVQCCPKRGPRRTLSVGSISMISSTVGIPTAVSICLACISAVLVRCPAAISSIDGVTEAWSYGA